MNYLNIRKGPQMETIIAEHKSAFEQHVIELYTEARGFWNVIPSLEADILSVVLPSYILASVLSEGTGDPSFFIKETEGKIIPEFLEYWSSARLKDLQEYAPGNVAHAMAGIFLDANSILEYHNMFFALQVAESPYGGTGIQGFKNWPIIEVW